MFERLDSQKNYMLIARQIRNLIRAGTLKVGDKLPPERSLVEQFGTSRASIREALSALEMLGLIECRSGRGNYVKADGSSGTIDAQLLQTLLQDHDPYEIYETRLELEPSLAALAAERATEEERMQLKAQVETMKTLGKHIRGDGFMEADIEAYMEADRLFHLEIGRCAHNNVLFTVFSGVNLMTRETHWKAMKSKGLADAKNITAYESEHDSILDAIMKKDPKSAHGAAKKHILMLRKTLF